MGNSRHDNLVAQRQHLGELRSEVARAGVEVGLEYRQQSTTREDATQRLYRSAQLLGVVGIVVDIYELGGINIYLHAALNTLKLA